MTVEWDMILVESGGGIFLYFKGGHSVSSLSPLPCCSTSVKCKYHHHIRLSLCVINLLALHKWQIFLADLLKHRHALAKAQG